MKLTIIVAPSWTRATAVFHDWGRALDAAAEWLGGWDHSVAVCDSLWLLFLDKSARSISIFEVPTR